ncbi:hypothetical protein PHISP_02258 [Aspergillus sp. HF37]|nr:hypothetical protein PHISP_02258 [Aspergillus sp. HF37]
MQAGTPSTISSYPRVYDIYHTLLHYDYNVFFNGSQLLHVDNSMFTRGKLDLSFHAGADKTAPVVSVCKILHFSRHFKVGFGDPGPSPNAVAWEDLAAQNLMASKYRVEMTIERDSLENESSSGDRRRRSFLWKCPIFSHDMKLFDEKTETVVALFNSCSSLFNLRKAGRIEIYQSYGPDFDLMVLTTALGLAEDLRRFENSTAVIPAGGLKLWNTVGETPRWY